MDELFDVFDEGDGGASAGGVSDSAAAAAATEAALAAARASVPTYTPAAEPKAAQVESADTRIGDKRLAGAVAAAESEQRAKAMRMEAKKARASAVLPSAMGAPGATRVSHEMTSDNCLHEVAYPPEYEYVSLSEFKGPEKPAKEYPFVLDPFQSEAIRCLERRESVLVSAHTSAGKTVVAEYAIAMSLRDTQRVIYTSPIKALSNQKFRELQEEFQDVGLMTGDVTINPGASCLVMTTEILRSMLYRGSELMREIGWVVFDEIHYMRDKERGVVWEETLILLPDNVHYVFLSATIPNALQFAKWIAQLHRQPCHVVYTDYRPTPLEHYFYPSGAEGMHLVVDDRGEFLEANFLKAMAVLGETSNQGKANNKRGRRGGTKGPSDCFRIVKMIMNRQLQPVIVFSFSKRDCESYALQMSKLDFNTDDEKRMVEEVFHNAIDCLSDDDKKLPQVEHVLPLLKRGIGIHHSGLLPILKETIEILFSEGLVKALFATETFAMGLNMPARTVVFTSGRKFDGKDMRWVSSGEYIQMSGRAGRRGLDDRGIVILMIDERMEPGIGKDLVKGQPDVLKSAFHLTYNMVLNLLRVEEINPEYMLERSFFQFQNNSAIPDLEKQLAKAVAEHAAVVIPDEENAFMFYEMRLQLDRISSEIQSIITQPQHALPFLNAGRLVRVRDGTDDWGWGAIVNFQKKVTRARGKALTPAEPVYIVEVLLNCSTGAHVSPKPAGLGEQGEMKVVPVLLSLLEKISSVKIHLPPDLRPLDARISVRKTISEVERRLATGIPQLDPVEHMNIKSSSFKSLAEKARNLESRIQAHPLSAATSSDSAKAKSSKEILKLCEKKTELAKQIKHLKREIKQSQSILQLDELKARKRVLRRLNFATADDVITLKGRVACEISTGDECTLTELIFAGVFNDLDVPQTVALLSCFAFGERSKDSGGQIQPALAAPLRQVQDTARRIAKISNDSKLPVDEEDFVEVGLESFSPVMMNVAYSWSQGQKFSDICKLTDVFEGSIIRCIRRLEELLRQLCNAAKVLGNTELENKFAEGITSIKRDIIFAASLYL